MSSGAEIVSELYRHLQNEIERGAEHHDIRFADVTPEMSLASGFADLVVTVEGDDPFLVIEAKREPTDDPDRRIDPYAQPVINQAANYALDLGAKYFATYNGDRLVLFRTFEEGTNLLDRRTRAYEIESIAEFAPVLLEELTGLDSDVVAWDPHRDAFVDRLQSFHDILCEEFGSALQARLESASFRTDFEAWVADQGWSDRYEDAPAEVEASFTSQAAYLLMNKLVFYKLLENAEAYDAVPDVGMEMLVDAETRRDAFRSLTEAVDFEAVYDQDPIFDSLSLSARARREVSQLLDDLEDYNLDQFDYDVIGKLYEEIIPPTERHSLGQYYTPDQIVNLIVELTIQSEDDVVLDPGCGSGGFLVGAYEKLKELKSDPDHAEILDQIHGVDINRFPAHLSAINLALRDLSRETHDVNVVVEDFFDLVWSQDRVVPADRASVRGTDRPDERGLDVPAAIDVAMANPPYIRNENIADKERAREHLDELGVDLSERSDIYCYFFTHAYQFLRGPSAGDSAGPPPGRMGFLTSNRWLSVGYGEDLQEFLLDNTKITAIVDFRTQQFDVPLIGTCVTILERCDDPVDRAANRTELVHVKQGLEPSEIADVVEDEHTPGTLYDGPDYRRITLRQEELRDVERWDRYLYAPSIYWDIVGRLDVCELGDVVDEVNFGTKTGANDYFYFQERAEFEEFGLDERFVRPILKHISPTEHIEYVEDDPHWYVLDLHGIVAEILESAEPSLLEERTDEEIVLAEFRNRGWDALVQYLELGTEREIDEGASVQGSGQVWFDVGQMDAPDLILPKEYWRDARVLYNRAGFPIDQRNYEVFVGKETDDLVLLGIMNSSLFAMIREVEGRVEQGQAMNRNELTVGEASGLHIPDPREFSTEQRERIRSIVADWLENERSASERDREEFQSRLDRAVLATIGFEDEVDELQDAVAALLRVREEGSGQRTGVLVESVGEDERDIELPGARRLEDGGKQRALDSF